MHCWDLTIYEHRYTTDGHEERGAVLFEVKDVALAVRLSDETFRWIEYIGRDGVPHDLSKVQHDQSNRYVHSMTINDGVVMFKVSSHGDWGAEGHVWLVFTPRGG
jgi:hypothetical protein